MEMPCGSFSIACGKGLDVIIGVVKETYPGEKRVALVPSSIPALAKAKLEVLVESGAGSAAGFLDSAYQEKGARIATTRAEVFAAADILLQVRILGANPDLGREDLPLMRNGQIVIGYAEPLTAHASTQQLAERGVVAFAMELMPRTTKAQSMDVLSSMATISGYKAVLLAAEALPKMFPMLMTAAGTISPARVFVIGAGVAGLQAIATAKRLGAVVEAYDVRPAVKEQVESVGGKFVELPLEAGDSEDKGGYAKALDEDFYRRQQELMKRVVSASDVVVTTALVPGKKAPVLITADAVRAMAPGSVIVDLAAERGGNCELTQADKEVIENGVLILGPTNLPATVPHDASQMYAKNSTTFLLHLIQDGKPRIGDEDEIIRETAMTREGNVVHPRILDLMKSS